MSRQARFLLEVSAGKLVFFAVFWIASFFTVHVAALLFPYESWVVFALYVAVQGLSLLRLAQQTESTGLILRLLLAADIVFGLYLTKFFFMSSGYVVVLFLGLIIFETLVVNAQFGAFTLACSVVVFVLLQVRVPEGYKTLRLLVDRADITFAVLSLIAVYVIAYFVRRHSAGLLSDAEVLAHELADATVASEIAKEELIKRNRNIGTLLKIAESLASSLEMKELFGNFEGALRDSLDFDNLSLMVCDPTEGVFRNLMSHSEIFEMAEAPIFPLDRGIAGVVYNRGHSYRMVDASTDPNFAPYSAHSRYVSSLISVPIYYHDEIKGVVTLDSREKEHFTDEHLHFLESVAPLLALAVNNVISFQVFKTASTRDKLTNLYNYFAFTRRFHELAEDCSRNRTALTLLMIDIDDFKKVNDTYGHLAGNQVLSQFGELLSMFFRRSDLIARYGGEEFAAVLYRTPLDVGLVLADNLRSQVEEFEFGPADGNPVHITVSVGVSSTADEGVEFDIRRGRRTGDESYVANLEEICERLISYADGALYESKSRGKNLVSASVYASYPRKDFTEYRFEADPNELPQIEKKVLRLDARL